MGIKTAYLVAYNAAQALGWAAVLGLTVLSIAENGSERYVYETCGFIVCKFRPSCINDVGSSAGAH